jgi:hypothetical protein
VDPAARAPHLVPVMLDGLRPRLGQVSDLVGVPHPQVPGSGRVSAARAGALREMRDRIVRVIIPCQVHARRARLFARPAAPPRRGLCSGSFFPGWSSLLGGHRRVPRVPGDQPLQPRDLLRLLRQLSLQFRVLGSQLRVLLPQPGVRLLQRGYHIRRTGHSGTTSQPTLSKEIDTVSRSATRSTRTHQADLNAYIAAICQLPPCSQFPQNPWRFFGRDGTRKSRSIYHRALGYPRRDLELIIRRCLCLLPI